MTNYIQGKEWIDDVAYSGLITLDANGLVDMDTTHTSGTVVSITNTPASSCDANILKVDVQSSPFSSGNCVHIVSADADCEGLKINKTANNTEFVSIGKTGTTYTTIGIGSSDQLLFQTTANDQIRLLPNGTGVTKVGSGTPTLLASNSDNLFVVNDVEVDGRYWHDLASIQNGLVLAYFKQAFVLNLPNDVWATYIVASASGEGYIQVGDNEEFAYFRWNTSDVVTLESNSALVVANATPAGRFCLVVSSGVLYLYNRLGSAKKLASYIFIKE